MTYSKIHQRFSKYSEASESLERPEDFLGPNCAAVINFWLWIDTLTTVQFREVAKRYDYIIKYNSVGNVEDAAHFVNPKAAHAALQATWHSIWSHYADDYGTEDLDEARAVTWATQELIGMHILLEQGKRLIFVSLFDNI
jgi:hypothetical protein